MNFSANCWQFTEGQITNVKHLCVCVSVSERESERETDSVSGCVRHRQIALLARAHQMSFSLFSCFFFSCGPAYSAPLWALTSPSPTPPACLANADAVRRVCEAPQWETAEPRLETARVANADRTQLSANEFSAEWPDTYRFERGQIVPGSVF